MVIVLTGSNDFARKAELRRLVADFVSQHDELGLERLQAAEVEIGRLLEMVSSLPFLVSKRMIILNDPSANKAIGEHIEKLLTAVPDTTDLIIVEPKFDKRSSLYKMLKKDTDFREFEQLDEQQLARWLVDEAKAQGGVLSHSDANYLVRRVGINQLGMSHELDKLLAYSPNISRDSIDTLTQPLPAGSVFELLDAAFAGNSRRAMELYREQRAQQVEPQAIMGMIAWQVHILASVAAHGKKAPEDIAREAKLNPFVVRKALAVTSKKPLSHIKKLVIKTLELDIRLKSERIDADDAVQAYLLSL